jgi:hypothetical protein
MSAENRDATVFAAKTGGVPIFMKRPLVVHPFLLGLSPILFLYTYNLAQIPVNVSELVGPVLLTLGATLLLWLALGLVLRDRVRSGLIVSLLVVLFFSYGHVFAAIQKIGTLPFSPRKPVVSLFSRHEYLLAVWLAILAAGVVLVIRTRRNLAGLTIVLNVIAAAIVFTNLLIGLPHLLRRRPAQATTAENRDATVFAAKTGSVPIFRVGVNNPDIYYIILDSYARSDILKEKFGYDNSDFIAWLRQQGFYVPDRGRSNYVQTYLSLASSLNFTYLDRLAAQQGNESQNRAPLIRMIEHSQVTDFLRRHGYTIVVFSSGYTGTDLKDADLLLAPRWALSEFQNVLLSTTLLPPLLPPLLRRSQEDLQRERVLYTLANIPRAGQGRRPVFVFSHLVSPHVPFVFGANGEPVKAAQYFRMTDDGATQTVTKQEVRKWYEENYRPQITYLTKRVREMVTQILAASPQSPVIVLQGDHGTGSILNWDEPDPGELAERHAILNAIRVPASDGERTTDDGRRTTVFAPLAGLYDSITPVNTFRYIFARLFDTSMALLPDRCYFSTIFHPYAFYNVDVPGEYPDAGSDQGPISELNVVAFSRAAKAPANPALYCRRLVILKYPRERRRVRAFRVQVVDTLLTEERAFALYQQSVQSGELPDFGNDCDFYQGRGPDQDSVAALYFRIADGSNHR